MYDPMEYFSDHSLLVLKTLGVTFQMSGGPGEIRYTIYHCNSRMLYNGTPAECSTYINGMLRCFSILRDGNKLKG
jgi:hypothetical protein